MSRLPSTGDPVHILLPDVAFASTGHMFPNVYTQDRKLPYFRPNNHVYNIRIKLHSTQKHNLFYPNLIWFLSVMCCIFLCLALLLLYFVFMYVDQIFVLRLAFIGH